MSASVTWSLSIRHDPWLDNGLEVLAGIAEAIARQHPAVLSVHLEPDGLRLEIRQPQRFARLLSDQIALQVKNAYYNPKPGRMVLKPFVGFNQQPPELYRGKEAIEAFVQELLAEISQPSNRRSRFTCPFCGALATEKRTLSLYPFVTKTKALSGQVVWTEAGFRGLSEYGPICSVCAFLGMLTWSDTALLYRCDIDGPQGTALLVLPWPQPPDLHRLHKQKQRYRHALKPTERRSNVQVVVHWGNREQKEWPPQAFTMLLAFYEVALRRVLAEIQQGGGESLFDSIALRQAIPDGWILIRIPQGRMKDITATDWFMEDMILRVMRSMIEADILPYQDVLTGMWLTLEGRPADPADTAAWREERAAAFLQNDYGRFAAGFGIRRRQTLAFYGKAAQGLYRWIQIWLEERGTMNEQELELVRRAGRTIGRIAGTQRRATILYELERARTLSDLLGVLSDVVHRLVGMEAQEMRDQYLSLEALDRLTALIHATGDDARRFADMKHTLFIYAGLEYAGMVRGQTAEAAAR
ncbi:hypothetical protein [Thermoflexus sp.]|uniref:hypothetical protein n=1 Tax=Thermoflexus sp. TaxID=1969742 RepID=UPI0035E45937